MYMSISSCVCRKMSRSKNNGILTGLLIGNFYLLCAFLDFRFSSMNSEININFLMFKNYNKMTVMQWSDDFFCKIYL